MKKLDVRRVLFLRILDFYSQNNFLQNLIDELIKSTSDEEENEKVLSEFIDFMSNNLNRNEKEELKEKFSEGIEQCYKKIRDTVRVQRNGIRKTDFDLEKEIDFLKMNFSISKDKKSRTIEETVNIFLLSLLEIKKMEVQLVFTTEKRSFEKNINKNLIQIISKEKEGLDPTLFERQILNAYQLNDLYIEERLEEIKEIDLMFYNYVTDDKKDLIIYLKEIDTTLNRLIKKRKNITFNNFYEILNLNRRILRLINMYVQIYYFLSFRFGKLNSKYFFIHLSDTNAFIERNNNSGKENSINLMEKEMLKKRGTKGDLPDVNESFLVIKYLTYLHLKKIICEIKEEKNIFTDIENAIFSEKTKEKKCEKEFFDELGLKLKNDWSISGKNLAIYILREQKRTPYYDIEKTLCEEELRKYIEIYEREVGNHTKIIELLNTILKEKEIFNEHSNEKKLKYITWYLQENYEALKSKKICQIFLSRYILDNEDKYKNFTQFYDNVNYFQNFLLNCMRKSSDDICFNESTTQIINIFKVLLSHDSVKEFYKEI